MIAKLKILEKYINHKDMDFKRFLEIRKVLDKYCYKYWYRIYLKSNHWRDTSKRSLEKYPVCQRCTIADSSQVHHVSYKNLGGELDGDLMSVCSHCHNRIHGINKRGLITPIGTIFFDIIEELETAHKRY